MEGRKEGRDGSEGGGMRRRERNQERGREDVRRAKKGRNEIK